MKTFYEKADETILCQCEDFILEHENSTANYYVFREALSLYAKLSQSLLDSQKEFDEAIAKEADKIVHLQYDIEKEIAMSRFNQAHYCLVLDQKAHDVLEKLETIESNNRRK